jgi:hypothetical protein
MGQIRSIRNSKESPEPPRIVAFVGDYLLIEAPGEVAQSVADAAMQTAAELFEKHFPNFQIKLESRIL